MQTSDILAERRFRDGELTFERLIAGLESGEITVNALYQGTRLGLTSEEWAHVSRTPFSNIRHDLTEGQTAELDEAIATARRRMGY